MYRLIYKKANGAFITIESRLLRKDSNYVYMECGKYLRKNIVMFERLDPPIKYIEGLEDDA